ncbi:hypothetical protein MLD38_020871 [Melastoma candidum]|uniref:Uncharacterized protein n=1 Tax=Melastoma candidum TaxID=119954 RepID=A0ACB9QEI3_9MYRT|nr:hypothetical protein MLD38_020871 [Melastoma candidum]
MPSAKPTTVAGVVDRLLSVYPEELRFDFELEKQSSFDLKIVNHTEKRVAFKVKTTSPKKYFVRPNSSIIQPQEECFVRVTLQAQREYPPDMQCRDKFLLQSTIVPPNTDMVELSQDIFNKDGGRVVEEIKLRVVYVYTNMDENPRIDNLGSPIDNNHDNDLVDLDRALQRLKTERDTAIRQVQLLQKDLELLKRHSYQRKPYGFSILATLFVGLVGIFMGLASTFLFAPQRNA